MALLQHIKLPAKKSSKRKHQEPDNVAVEKKTKTTHYEKQQQGKAADDQCSDDVQEDRLTNMPEPIKHDILSFLNPKQAVQTSLLSKSWASSWTSIPVLNLNSYGTKLSDFDKIATKILSTRDKSVKLNKLTFNRGGSSSAMILKTVFGYVLSNGVKEAKAWINSSRNGAWPDCLHTTCSHSLTRLKLISHDKISCRFLGQSSAGLFKNLTNLYLRKAVINDPDPFSGFPALEKLTLYHCCYEDDYTLNVRASQLSVLTIKCHQSFERCELSTPKLRMFKFRAGGKFPVFVTPQALPLLDEVVFDYQGLRDQKKSFEDMITMFWSFHNAKSLTISKSIVQLLTKFEKELVTQCSPFRGLKFLKSDRDGSGEIPSDVKDYLLHYSADAKISMVKIKY